MSGLADRPILDGTPSATEAQGRAYLTRSNAAHATARGIPPLAAAEIATICAAYWRIGARYGIDPAPALAQSIHETAAYTFGGQVNAVQHNPAGLGATNDGAAGGGWPDWPHGIEAAYIHLLCWCNDPRGDGDYRFDAVRAAIHAQGKATSWRSLGGRWAVPGVGYGEAIEAIWTEIIAEKGATVTLSKPAVRSVPSPNCGYNGAAYHPEAICWHITEGSGASAVNWLSSPASSASANYVVMESGEIVELVNPEDGANGAAWANGNYTNPDLSNALIAGWVKGGVNGNLRVVSVEHAGMSSNNQGGSLTAAQITATVHLAAWLCSRFGISPDQDHILGHYQFDNVTRHNCPGFSAAEWSAWVGQIAALVQGGTVSNAPTPTPTPTHPAGYLEQGQPDTFNWEGSGVVVARTATFYNPDEHAYYTRTWNNAQGFTPWLKVG